MEKNYYENLIATNSKEAEALIRKQNNILDEIIDSFIFLRERQKNEEKNNILNTKNKVKEDDENHFLETHFLENID